MSDIFREVEEDVRRERYEHLWKQYGDYVIAAAAFVIIAAAGFQLWRYYEQRESIRASSEYTAAQLLLDSGQTPAAAEAFGKIAADAPGGYAQVARLQEAGALLASGRIADGLKLYNEIASGSDSMLAGIARVRTGWALVETAPRSQLESLLAPLTDPANAWNPMAREILAYSDFRKGATKQALAEYKSLSADKNAPPSLHQRSEAMATFLAAGGDENYGTVPRPPASKAAPAAAPQNPQGAKPK